MDTQSNFWIVDDNDTDLMVNSRIIQLTLKEEPVSFKSAKSALNTFFSHTPKQFQASKPLVVFLDINMPVIDGFMFVEELKNHHVAQSSIKVILLTSREPDLHIKQLLSSQYVKGVLLKPLNPDQLLSVLDDQGVGYGELPSLE